MTHIVRLFLALFLFLGGALLAIAQAVIYRDYAAALATIAGAIAIAGIVAPGEH